MTKVIFLTGLFPPQFRNEIEAKSIGVIQYAADALQWSIVHGLDYHTDNLKIINLPYVGSYPLRYKDFKLNSFTFSHKSGACDINVSFLNLPLIKLYSRYYNAKKTLQSLLYEGNEVVMIYAIHTPFIKAAVDLKNRNPSLKICLVVPDLPEFMSDNESFFYKVLKNTERKILNKLLDKIDSFVILTDYMHESLNIGKRPWVRIEGIFSSVSDNFYVEKEQFKTILYSGTLARRYGIINLLDAFTLIKHKDYRLWICGDGDAKEELIERVKLDHRIIFFGQIPREQVLLLQKRATVLVNPRTSEGEYTKYSFPSKTMEYLASGTPCIMNKLKGIPKDYFDFLFFPENESFLELSNKIIEVCNKEKSELKKIGEKATRFILVNKSPEKQCEKIFNMLKKM